MTIPRLSPTCDLDRLKESAERVSKIDPLCTVAVNASDLLALLRESARLTFLQDEAASVYAIMDMDPEAAIGFRVVTYSGDVGEGATLADAIDAIMEATDA